MKNAFIINKLEKAYIDKLILASPPRVYNAESELIYEGHVPTAGYLLIEGEVHFLKRKRVVQTAKEGALFGVSELMNNYPVKYTVRIQPNSKVCILDKSTIKELIKEYSVKDLPDIFKSLVT